MAYRPELRGHGGERSVKTATHIHSTLQWTRRNDQLIVITPRADNGFASKFYQLIAGLMDWNAMPVVEKAIKAKHTAHTQISGEQEELAGSLRLLQRRTIRLLANAIY